MGFRKTQSSIRINAIAAFTQAKTYLEVGVSEGDTFFNVDIKHKVAVDPYFQFDYMQYQTDSTILHQIPSDEYFIHHAEGQKFDIIFLDGLHTFEQTFRDFCNTQCVAHDKTIWLIDDTVPSDIYSAHTISSEAIALRSLETKNVSGLWHGDVYKTIFAIADFFPMFSYCTSEEPGYEQTFVYKRPVRHFTPLFNNLEAISRLEYFDFFKRKNHLKLMPLEDCLNKIMMNHQSYS
ncbi:MAG: class I SAM-dependent methyltransferase [Desulfovibrio sp.]